MGSVGHNSTFSEHGHVAYQIKENQECSNMVANIMPADPPSPSIRTGLIVKFQLFHYMVMLHIKLKGITKCSNTVTNICLQTPHCPLTFGIGSIGQKLTFSEHGHVAYQIKGNNEMQQHGSKYFAGRPSSPLTGGMGSIGQNSTFFRTWSC